MQKRKQRKTKPRYLTIRIQYYPIPRGVFAGLFIIVMLFGSWLSGRYLLNESREKISYRIPLSSKSFNLDDSDPGQARMTDEVIFHGAREKKQIALTFDADMTPGMEAQLQTGEVESYYNKSVIALLNQTQTKATLFLAGMWIEMYPDESRELALNPLFELASHSYSHPGFDGECYGLTPLPDEGDQEEIQKTQRLLKNITGFDNKLFRFPGGCYSQKDVAIVHQNGLLPIQWDVVGQDGFNYDPIAIEENVLNTVQNGSIIVLHMHGGPNAPETADALPNIIATLKERGFTFVTVSELLNRDTQVYKFTTHL